MSSTLTNMQERASEWRATAEAAMVVRILTELAAEVSTKRFVRSRASRAERGLRTGLLRLAVGRFRRS